MNIQSLKNQLLFLESLNLSFILVGFKERQIGLIRELLNDRNGRNTLNEQERERLFMLSTTHRSHLEGSPSKR